MRVPLLLAGLSVLLMSCANTTAGHAMALNPTLSDYVQRSGEVAIVSIQRVEHLVSRGSPNTSCGYVYKAVVRRNIKGTGKRFRFYSDIGANYLGRGYRYLVIAIPFPESKAKFDAMNTNDLNVCQANEATRLWVPWEYPLMVPLIHEESKDWILTAKYSLLFIDVFDARTTIINRHCYAAVPLHDALGLISAAGGGNSAIAKYLRDTYPKGDHRYRYLANPCGWAAGKH